ncbi:MAG: Crp/Fnr family transcriptional regulator [Eubacteriales bacterium]
MNTDILHKSILFKDLTKEDLKNCLVALNAHEKHYKKGETVLYSGDTTDYMGLVLNGSVTIESNDIWGNCSILSHVSSGNFFAETYALLPNEVLLVDVIANEDCKILFFNIKRLFSDITTFPFKEKVLKNLLIISSYKNLALSKRNFHTVSKSSRKRLLSYLNAIAVQKHSSEFDIPFNRQQLADYLNLERTNMSKELTRMQKDGIIQFHKNHFKIIKK